MATLQTAPFRMLILKWQVFCSFTVSENKSVDQTRWKDGSGLPLKHQMSPSRPQLVDGLSRIWQALGSNQWTGVSWPQNEPLLDEVMTVDCIVLNLVHSISFWPPSSVSLSLSLMSLCRSDSLVFTFSFLAHYICLSLYLCSVLSHCFLTPFFKYYSLTPFLF